MIKNFDKEEKMQEDQVIMVEEKEEEKTFGFCENCGLIAGCTVKYEKVGYLNLPHKYCDKCGKRVF
ncbi:MAG TPA: hypothetical protein PKH95_00315 [Candidatus Magasanikbacteria bacterium]|nr:hypothetical protein [Candidatus Magasanikbacteria bacterium]